MENLIHRIYEFTVDRQKEAVIFRVSSSLGWQSHLPLARLSYRIAISGNGQLDLRARVRITEERPPLPRFGLLLRLPGDLNRAEYLGYGPFDSYADKREAVWWGAFAENADAAREKHIRPQESGAHTGCARLVVRGNTAGLRITSRELFSFRLTHYEQRAETAARHRDELLPEADTFLLLDRAQAGIGTGSCGPVPAPEFQLTQKDFQCHFRLEPFIVPNRQI